MEAYGLARAIADASTSLRGSSPIQLGTPKSTPATIERIGILEGIC